MIFYIIFYTNSLKFSVYFTSHGSSVWISHIFVLSNHLRLVAAVLDKRTLASASPPGATASSLENALAWALLQICYQLTQERPGPCASGVIPGFNICSIPLLPHKD